ncbi:MULTISPECIES: hypothetical protein [unclassified Nostoc]|uniref:hypothetical protein n=1 Tax=unclassified Nostoc TaxID=2593658 RepID=UPI001DBFEB18|nr:hypothetical protein [Nostoc sp. JL23]MBN3881026.1 hypothetical protein [Nostoc sp. JL23]
MAEDLSNSSSSNSSTSGNNPLGQSPFGRLTEVLSDKDLANLFSGVGNGESGGSPFGGGAAAGGGAAGGSQPDLAYGGNPFAGDNFWNIFAGGVNPSTVGGSPSTGGGIPSTVGGSPSTGGGNQGSGYDPLTGSSSQTYGISTTEIPDGFTLRATIDKLVNSKLDKEVGGGQTSPFPTGGQTSPFPTGGQTSAFPTDGQTSPFPTDGQTSPFPTSGQNPFA